MQLSSTGAGVLLLIGQLADGIATPIVGYFSDRTRSRFGKRRLWVCMGSLAVAFTFPTIFHRNLFGWDDQAYQLQYYSVVIIAFQFAWASTQVSHLALVPELTLVPTERVVLNSIRSFATIASNVTVFILAWVLLQKHSDNSSLGPADEAEFGALLTLSLYLA
jgi:Na+/melibiose symporter-like transporter